MTVLKLLNETWEKHCGAHRKWYAWVNWRCQVRTLYCAGTKRHYLHCLECTVFFSLNNAEAKVSQNKTFLSTVHLFSLLPLTAQLWLISSNLSEPTQTSLPQRSYPELVDQCFPALCSPNTSLYPKFLFNYLTPQIHSELRMARTASVLFPHWIHTTWQHLAPGRQCLLHD